MKPWKGLTDAAEGSGLTTPLGQQVNMLGELLGHAIREVVGTESFERVEKLRLLCKSAYQGGDTHGWEEARAEISTLPVAELVWLVRAFTTFFHLTNKAEQREIVRINRERERTASTEKPRSESIPAAVSLLKQRGYSRDQTLAVFARLDIQPTLTAHPTEARRRAILGKQKEIARLLERLQRDDQTPAETEQTMANIYEGICLLLVSDEFLTASVSVMDEVHHGLHFLTTSIWDTVPRIYHDIQHALQVYYQSKDEVPSILRYRSWIGGDRDGNPFVTPDVTRDTLELMRTQVIKLYQRELRRLRRSLSVSSRLLKTPKPLQTSLQQDKNRTVLPEGVLRLYSSEPFRLKLSYMIARLQALVDRSGQAPKATNLDNYDAEKFFADLNLVRVSLRVANLARSRLLDDLCARLKTFGFHLAALDIRQHSSVHEQAVTELFKIAGVVSDYAELDENAKLAVLHKELQTRRPLVHSWEVLSPVTENVLKTLRLVEDELVRDAQAIGSYIVSMTHHVSDMLEVLLLAREVGLWQYVDGSVRSSLELVPLFETIDDLARIGNLMTSLFSDPIYRSHLRARDDFQEVMLGYSDSNKDGGYGMANWSLYDAQQSVAEVCGRFEIDFRLFHGRGGTVGRGGGRANQAILAMPQSSNNGRIRFTEQGEVITFRYSSSDLAHRHLEQIVHAMLIASEAPSLAKSTPKGRATAASDRMIALAQRSMKAYQSLIHDPSFWPWYVAVTPIEHISRLPIASRPVSRKAAHEVDFEGLRAIPWVFAWTQTRYNVPGWYGMGVALSELVAKGEDSLQELQKLYHEWPFFRVVIDNVQLEMKRAHLPIAHFYSTVREGNFHKTIADDFGRASTAVCAITGKEEILDNEPVLKKSITLRNPYTDVLNLLQIELLQRWRHSASEEQETLRHALFLSINGIAAAMQSTG